MISLQTNVDSLDAQSNLNVDNQFQSKTIQQLTSGYRINSSGDDAAGLAVANGLRDNIAELTQGVNNANDGVSQLQIVDGGLSNISTILDRMKTLATESASGTFTGNRATLDQEYQGLVSEITRQASNINLNAGGSFNSNLSIYIGGANNAANANVSVNLSGANNAVDAVSLGLAGTSVQGGGTSFSGTPATNLNDPNALFDTGNPSTQGENFSVSYTNASGQVQSTTVSVAAATAGMTGSQFVSSLNTALSNAGVTGVSAQIGSDGTLQFSGGNLLSVTHSNNGASSLVAADGASLINGNNYSSTGNFTAFTDGTTGHTTENMTITAGGQNYNVTLTSDTTNASEKADTLAHAVASINTQLQGSGVYAVANGSQITLQGAGSFTVSETNNTPGSGSTPGTGSFYGTTPGAQTVSAPTADAGSTGNADTAISAINSAIQSLGLVQGRVGAGENLLQYAINLAQSQITNFSSAESSIRDADVASDAANLTKSQVLEQTAIAAMAQANSEPQAVLKLLQ